MSPGETASFPLALSRIFSAIVRLPMGSLRDAPREGWARS